MYIYSKRGNPTAKALAELIGCRYGLRTQRRNPRWEQFKLIVSWGKTFPLRDMAVHSLNTHIVNKRNAFNMLKDSNCRDNIPKYWDYLVEVNCFPVFGRNYSHTQGQDIIIIDSEEDITDDLFCSAFYVQYIPKISEFRVHVFHEEILRIDKKVKIEGREYTDEELKVRCSNNGWRQIRYNKEGRYYNALADLGIKAVRAIGYDFGAVDIIIDRERRPIILEINSAPALRGDKLELYANAFKNYEELT